MFLCPAAPAQPQPKVIDAKADAQRQFPQVRAVLSHSPAPDAGKELVIENLKIQNVLNQTAIEVATIGTPASEGQPSPHFSSVTIRNLALHQIERNLVGQNLGARPGGIHIYGAADRHPNPGSIHIENVTITDCQGPAILIRDGKFDTIRLQNVKLSNANVGVQIQTLHGGSIGRIEVKDSPGLKVTLLGQPGTIEQCLVINSPGAQVTDEQHGSKKSGVTILRDGDKPVLAAQQAGPAPGAAEPKLVATVEGKHVTIKLENIPTDARFVTVGLFDRLDYRIGVPVTLTESPWEAKLPLNNKTGQVMIRATIAKGAGDPQGVLTQQLDVRK